MFSPWAKVVSANAMPFPSERTRSFPLYLAVVVDANSPATRAGAKTRYGGPSGTVPDHPRAAIAEPVFAHQQQSGKDPFYHFLQRRRI